MLLISYREEVNVSPWDEEFKSIKKGANSKSWKKKIPYAYWKGNPDVVSPIRLALLECNDTELWGARIMRQVNNPSFVTRLFLNKDKFSITFSFFILDLRFMLNNRTGRKKQNMGFPSLNYQINAKIGKICTDAFE